MQSYNKPIEVEIVNAGKRMIRYNVIPFYLPINESKITQTEVPNQDGVGTHTETIYPDPEIDHWEYDERVEYSSCYALLSFSDYFRLNMLISKAEGFDLSKSTERYTTMSPKACKVNIQPDGSYDVALIFEVTAEVQRRYSEMLAGIELVDTYVPIEGGISELIVTSLDPEVIDWTLIQYLRVGAKENNMVLKVSDSLLSVLPTNISDTLNQLGIIIDTI